MRSPRGTGNAGFARWRNRLRIRQLSKHHCDATEFAAQGFAWGLRPRNAMTSMTKVPARHK